MRVSRPQLYVNNASQGAEIASLAIPAVLVK